MSTSAAIAKATAALLSDERGRKALGWLLVAALAPLFVLVAFLCVLGAGSVEHNEATIQACFYGTELSAKTPEEYKTHIEHMRTAFTRLDAAVASANASAEDGSLDATLVKAAFFVLCFGDDIPTNREAGDFVGCFYTTETRTREVEPDESNNPEEPGADDEADADEGGEPETEEYTVVLPLSLESAYANLAAELDREITVEDKANIREVYAKIAGPLGGYDSGSVSYGNYELGGGFSDELDVPLDDPTTKSAADLVNYAKYAWQNGWGYCWGTIGYIMTPEFLESKAAQYPEGVGDKRSTIESLWMGHRTTDCVGLIKSYGWYDPESQSIVYGSNGVPDFSANQMYYAATESGPIDTIPEIPGLAVWHDGHIGVYIGGGEVIEAMGTNYGIVKTKLENRYFTHWLKIACIEYD